MATILRRGATVPTCNGSYVWLLDRASPNGWWAYRVESGMIARTLPVRVNTCAQRCVVSKHVAILP